MPPDDRKRKLLSGVLVGVFLLAMVMGCGPGIYLINPHPADPGAMRTLCSVPVVYAWAVFWCAVQAGVIVAAYFLVWKTEE